MAKRGESKTGGLFDVPTRQLTLSNNGIHIGTSGYVFQDWRGSFYPEKLRQDKWLEFYAREFDCVEINVTYYRTLPAHAFASMADRTDDRFGFWVKLPGGVTHTGDDPVPAMVEWREAVKPLVEAGKMRGGLAQFPPSIYPGRENMNRILRLRELSGTELAVEFRRVEWQNEEIAEVFDRHGIISVALDAPAIKGMPLPTSTVTGEAGYIRFHGRNKLTWNNPSAGDRYDYDYERSEIAGWIPRIEQMKKSAELVYIFFNNCHAGQAVRSARMLRDLLQTEFLPGNEI